MYGFSEDCDLTILYYNNLHDECISICEAVTCRYAI